MSWLRERRGVWRGLAASLGLLAAAGLRGQAIGSAPAPAAPRPVDLPAGTLLFHRNVVRDTDGTGLEAYTIDLPAGWQGESQVLWDLDRKVAPSDLLVRVVNPRGGQEFMYLPSVICVWSPKYQAMAAQLKGKIQGCRILEPVDGPLVAIQKLVIPDNFKDLDGKYTVTSSQELPDLAAAYAPTYNRPGRPQRVVRAGKVRIEFDEGGRTMQQDVYCVFILARTSGGVIWELDHTVSFKEEKGIPDQTDRQFALLAVSLQPTAKFLDAQEKMTELLLQGASRDPRVLMRAVAAAETAQPALPPPILDEWQTRQGAEAEAVKDYEAGGIRGVRDERDPHSGDVLPVPGDIAHVWSNSGGDIVYTDSATFQPTELMPADWQELTPVTP
jgi:hypothetical protein